MTLNGFSSVSNGAVGRSMQDRWEQSRDERDEIIPTKETGLENSILRRSKKGGRNSFHIPPPWGRGLGWGGTSEIFCS